MQAQTTALQCAARIKAYFRYVKGGYYYKSRTPQQRADGIPCVKVISRQPEPLTYSGLALALGFNSRHDLELYEQNGEHAGQVKRAKLRIEAEYEKKLHQPHATGAIFVLKDMGWTGKAAPAAKSFPKSIVMQLVSSGPPPAETEKDVDLGDEPTQDQPAASETTAISPTHKTEPCTIEHPFFSGTTTPAAPALWSTREVQARARPSP